MRWFAAVPSIVAAVLLALAHHRALADAPTPDKSGYTLFNPAPDTDLRTLATDRPDKSTTPYTVDAGHFQLETDLVGVSYDGYGSAGTQTRELFAADPVLKLGVTNFADVEVALGGYQAYHVQSRDGAPPQDYDGFGDVLLRTKLNLLGNDGGNLVIAVEPFFKVPTATRGLGNGAGEWGLIIPVQYPLPYHWTLLAVTEFDDFKNPLDTGRHAGFTNLINLSRPLTAKLTMEVELWSQVQAAHVASQYTLDLALQYLLTPNTQLDGAAYVGLNKAAPDVVGYIGLSQRF